ncbi:MAG: phosphotransferase [Coxiellaceae bacterium]|nr:phosphotransferase [Coxiellaceae bacterium]
MNDAFFIKEIIQHYDLQKDSVNLLRQGINRTYTATDNQNQAVIIRIQPDTVRDKSWIIAELEFCSYLNQMGLTTNTAIASKSNEYITEINDDRVYFITVFNCFNGTEVNINNPKLCNPDTLHLYGKTLAQLHNFSEQYQPNTPTRPHFQQLLNHVPQNDLPSSINNIKHEFFDKASTLQQTKINHGLIHGDFKFDNMLLKNNHFQLFDFDHSFYYFYVADLLLPLKIYFCLPGLGLYPASNQQIDDFLQPTISGYRQQRALTSAQLQQLPMLMQGSFIRAYIELHFMRHMDDYNSEQLMDYISHHLDYNNRLFDYDFSWSNT